MSVINDGIIYVVVKKTEEGWLPTKAYSQKIQAAAISSYISEAEHIPTKVMALPLDAVTTI